MWGGVLPDAVLAGGGPARVVGRLRGWLPVGLGPTASSQLVINLPSPGRPTLCGAGQARLRWLGCPSVLVADEGPTERRDDGGPRRQLPVWGSCPRLVCGRRRSGHNRSSTQQYASGADRRGTGATALGLDRADAGAGSGGTSPGAANGGAAFPTQREALEVLPAQGEVPSRLEVRRSPEVTATTSVCATGVVTYTRAGGSEDLATSEPRPARRRGTRSSRTSAGSGNSSATAAGWCSGRRPWRLLATSA